LNEKHRSENATANLIVDIRLCLVDSHILDICQYYAYIPGIGFSLKRGVGSDTVVHAAGKDWAAAMP